MGYSGYSHERYAERLTSHHEAGTDVFTHTDDIRSGRQAAGVHPKLNPAGLNRLGQNIRESRDSDEHPVSQAIAVLFDVTGSMARVPRTFVEKLGGLMTLMNQRGYVPGPQIMFGGLGDATCDQAALQIGQFESGNEMDEALTLLFLEGGGGPSITESYELGMYYLARHAQIDCWDKRQKKGYLFLMGDEIPYTAVKAREVKDVIGDTIPADIPLAEILAELRQKWEVYWILPGGTACYNDRRVTDRLAELFGQSLIRLPNPGDICELIATTIALAEGHSATQISTDLTAAGADSGSVARATSALSGIINRPRRITLEPDTEVASPSAT